MLRVPNSRTLFARKLFNMSDATSTMDNNLAGAADAPLMTSDGVPLKQKLAQTTRRARLRALLLTMPLVIFITISFVIPIGQMLYRSVHNTTASGVLPNFSIAIKDWDETGLPSEKMFELFVKDIQVARKKREIGKTVGSLGTRINL